MDVGIISSGRPMNFPKFKGACSPDPCKPPPQVLHSQLLTPRRRVPSSPGPSQHGEKYLVHTNCTCASLYPESGYKLFSCKITQ